jgi:hypothetical protein
MATAKIEKAVSKIRFFMVALLVRILGRLNGKRNMDLLREKCRPVGHVLQIPAAENGLVGRVQAPPEHGNACYRFRVRRVIRKIAI